VAINFVRVDGHLTIFIGERIYILEIVKLNRRMENQGERTVAWPDRL
jgi:hypothetical protein